MMKLLSITALTSCAALVIAQPLEKRVLVVETVFEKVVETVDVTATVWVKPGEQTPAAAIVTPQNNVAIIEQKPSSPPAVAPAPVSTPLEPAPEPAKKNQVYKAHRKHKHNKRPRSSAKPIETPPPPPPPAPVVTPEAISTTQEQVPAPVVTPEAIPSPQVQIPAPVEEPKKENPSSQSTGGECGTVGGQCSGDLTFYDAGLGACGWTNDGETEDVFALAHGMMGTQSNGNPFCGRSATVTANGKSVVVKLVDKCMGCEGQDIDLSNHAIDQLMDRSVGRMHNVKWSFND